MVTTATFTQFKYQFITVQTHILLITVMMTVIGFQVIWVLRRRKEGDSLKR